MPIPDGPQSLIRQRFVGEPGRLGFGTVAGSLLFVVVSGLAIWVLPFGVPAQVCVVLHTVVGTGAAAAFAAWQLRHWIAARREPRTSRKLCAYLGFWLLAASLVMGLAISWQAVFDRYMSRAWDSLHLWTGLLAVPLLAYHMWPTRAEPASIGASRHANSQSQPRMWKHAVVVAGLLCAIAAVISVYCARVQERVRQRQVVGTSDFRPSMAETAAGRPIPVETLASSDSCGTSDCHAAIYSEWKASAHRWSAEDEFFQEVRTVTTAVKGVHETEKCGACHDPVSMLSGHKDPKLGRAAPGYKEGDSCVACHAVRKVDERGIGSYLLGSPKPYLFESPAGGFERAVNHFLIRAYPEQHHRDYDLTILRKPESCAPCHKEFDVLNEQEGPVQVETQFDDWKHGRWNTDADPARRLYCQQCHMQLVAAVRAQADPYDLKWALGLRHRNHSFAAANQYMPGALSLPDAKTHVEQVEQWLRGERNVAEIEKNWPQGPIVELKIAAPEFTRVGTEVAVTVVLSNRKVGHSFPTGPLNIARAWIELVVEDGSGETVFHSGLLDENNHIEDGSYILKPLAMDVAGHMILKPDLWHPVGPKFRRAVLAGESDRYEYVFPVPRGSSGPLNVKARLRYAKANQFFMDAVYPGQRRRAPVTDISFAQSRIELR